MSNFARFFLVLPFVFLAGCGESINGAYEASIQYQDEKPRTVGLAVIQSDRIIADGRTVGVKEWKFESDAASAFGSDGKRLALFKKNAEGDLVQELPMSRVIYKKFVFK